MSTSKSGAEGIIADPDVILVGSGIMSATLGVMLKCLDPRLKLQLFEAHSEFARESSDGWNNAGTGHAAFCEITYTPGFEPDGSVNIARALAIREQFERSLQFWCHAVASGLAGDPDAFIHAVPHMTFVRREDDIRLLKARHTALAGHHFFRSMAHTTDPDIIAGWAPLVMEGRRKEPVAATRVDGGTDVDFGTLARRFLGWLAQQEGCGLATGQRVTALRRTEGKWEVAVREVTSGERRQHRAGFVFVGAGGGSLPLLQSTGFGEVAGLSGFPIGGQWLVCDDPDRAARHGAKVYGAVHGSAPSLGAPHLDVRVIDGRRHLLFGPFVSWTTRFLKEAGHWTDLPGSLRVGNLATLLRTGARNHHLVRYLVAQALQSMDDRLAALRELYPAARAPDWRLREAGIRVQTLKKPDGGAITYGTEIFTLGGNTLAALLGASPGASVSVNIALDVVKTCLPHLLASSAGRDQMKAMIPAFDKDLKQPGNARLFETHNARAEELLKLHPSKR
ncbi:MAG: malate:quinone oxidoreductase [Verrucomicrobia bacterium]|nr:malate:quinone oxidoreductase [Verrucomicrobiota bacterium]